MKNVCKDCEHFKIIDKPAMPFNTGLVVCELHNLSFDYTSDRRLNTLTCIGGGSNETTNRNA